MVQKRTKIAALTIVLKELLSKQMEYDNRCIEQSGHNKPFEWGKYDTKALLFIVNRT